MAKSKSANKRIVIADRQKGSETNYRIKMGKSTLKWGVGDYRGRRSDQCLIREFK